MTIRLLLAAAIAAGLVLASAAAEDAVKPGMAKSKTTKAHKKKMVQPARKARMPEEMMQPYSTQKDEMTR